MSLHPLLLMLDTPAEILDDAYRYILTIDLGVLVMFAYNLCAGLLRAIGNSVMPLVFLLISSGLNVVLDLVFIARIGMGVKGAAVATVISQGVSVVLCILYIFLSSPEDPASGKTAFQGGQPPLLGAVQPEHFHGPHEQHRLGWLGGAAVWHQRAGHAGHRRPHRRPEAVLLYGACHSLPWHAGSTFVSQNCGANHPERVRKGMREIYLYSVVVAVLAVLLMNVGAEWMVG